MPKPLERYARAAGRVLGRRSMENRYVRGGLAAADTTLRGTARTGRVLWLQLVGAVCAVFALSVGVKLVSLYQNRAAVENAGAEIGIAGVVVAIFLWFAVSSFWRASRLKRQ